MPRCGSLWVVEMNALTFWVSKRDDWPLPDPKGQGIESVRHTRDEIKRVLQLLAQEQLSRNQECSPSVTTRCWKYSV